MSIAADVKTEAAMTFIRQNIGRPALSATLISRGVGVSRSVLYRLFKGYGGVACFIKRQRLLAMRDALSMPGETRPISALARSCGFSCESHASRSFREEFGTSPGEYRSSCRAASADALDLGAVRSLSTQC